MVPRYGAVPPYGAVLFIRKESKKRIGAANAFASGAAGGSLAVLIAALVGVRDPTSLTVIGAAGSAVLAALERFGLFQIIFADRVNRCLQHYQAMFIGGVIDEDEWKELRLHCLRRYSI